MESQNQNDVKICHPPWKIRAVNRVGSIAMRWNPAKERTSFETESLLDEARRRTGFSSFGPGKLRPALETLANSLDREAHLTFHGRMGVRQALVGSLVNRLHAARNVELHPEILDVKIEKPVFIIGLMRTGSTLLHNLMSKHPDLRVPLLWELGTPASPGADWSAEESIIRSTQAYVDDYYYLAPSFKPIHFIDALRPDECHRLTGNAFESMVYEMRYDVPSYGDWLAESDSLEAYRYHRYLLQHILHRKPGSPVVLKCPFHIWKLPSLLAIYPDARIIHLHRDPAKVVPSTCSLCAAIRTARAEKIYMHSIGRNWLESTARAVQRLEREDYQRERYPEARFLDVLYKDLIRDVLGTLRRIYDFIEVPFSAVAEEGARQWLADNPSNKHGRHRYSAKQFGLDPLQVNDRFAEYRERYAVPVESIE